MVAGDLSIFADSVEKIEDTTLAVSQLLTGINVATTEVTVTVVPRNSTGSTTNYDIIVSVLETT